MVLSSLQNVKFKSRPIIAPGVSCDFELMLLYSDKFLDAVIWPKTRQDQWYHFWPGRPTGTLGLILENFGKFVIVFTSRALVLLYQLLNLGLIVQISSKYTKEKLSYLSLSFSQLCYELLIIRSLKGIFQDL